MELLEHQPSHTGPALPVVPEVDEAAARRTLRDQIGRLEWELGQAFVAAYGRTEIDVRVRSHGGPRILSLGELESLRDALAERLSGVRRVLEERREAEREARVLIERMMLEPGRYRWVRVSNEDIGEPGCRHWHVLPRFGLLGMLTGWWRVKISSGCPLAGGPRACAAPPRSA
jgi:hypothetical protein